MPPPSASRPGDTVVRRPRESEIAPVTVEVEPRKVSVRGPASPMLLVYSFLVIIAIGTVILMLPISTHEGAHISLGDRFIQALFTATSAAAVTGLTVVDSSEGWSHFGQAVIMALIFIGGLGFMTGAAFLLLVVGQRLGLEGQLLIRAGLGETQLGAIATLVRRIVIFSLVTQALGTVLLLLRWYFFGELWEGISFAEALWQSGFHSVSAFNNAGFEIIHDQRVGAGGLEAFKGDAPMLLIMSALIIIGGLSYFVLSDIASRRDFRRLRLDTKLVLIGTAGLLVVGTLVFLGTEWSNEGTIGDQDTSAKVVNAFFHSATVRTAGFNTVDYAETTEANSLVTEGLMFIGGASASAAGGIKVNTFMVVMIAALATLLGRRRTTAFGREIPAMIVQRAVVIGAVATAVLLLLFAVLVTVQPDLDFHAALFEVMSAFGTVGLSTGITPELHTGGKIVITIAMFLGRFGPITLALLLAGREENETYRFANERVRIG